MVVFSKELEHDKWSTRAKGKEKRCDWLGATIDYQNSAKAHLKSENFLLAGETQERIGWCFERAAFQAKTLESFQRLVKSAADAYRTTVSILKKLDDPRRDARIASCEAKGVYVKIWTESIVSVKRRMLHRCCTLAREALDAFERMRDQQGIAETCNDIIVYLDERLMIASGKKAAQVLLREADSYCERAIEVASSLGDEYEIARAYYNAGHHYYVSVFLRPLSAETENNRQKALGYLQRAVELFEKMNETYLSILTSLDFARIAYSRITMETKSGIKHFERVSKQIADLRDNHVAARASLGLSLNSWWMMRLEQDPEKKRKWYHKCVRYAKKTINYSCRISDDSAIAFACWLHAYAKHAFAQELETRPNMRRLLLEESVNISRKGVKHAERSGVQEAVHFTKHSLCLSLLLISEVETDISKISRALGEALERGEECIEAARVSMPYDLWNLGLNECFLALILIKQAEIESDGKRQKILRERASSYWMKGQESALEYLALYPDGKRYWGLGGLSLRYGESLSRLYHLTGRKDILNEVIGVYTESASMFKQVDLRDMIAHTHWQIARALDLQERFSDAAKHFNQASRSFTAAAERTPLLMFWYSDNALYMLAWEEIEKAKLCNGVMNYSESAEHYKKASTYLRETLKWRYLSPYYLALSLVELGEYLRKQNELEKANRTFDEAVATFEQAEIILKSRQNLAETPEEKEEILKLNAIAKVKRKSCKGQVTIEDAKVLIDLPDYPERAAGLNAFEDTCIRARITGTRDYAVGRETRIGLDIVNIGRKPGVVVRIEKLVPPVLSVLEISPRYTLEGESLNMEGKLLGPLQTISISIRVRPTCFDAIELGPRVVYLDYHGDFTTYNVEPILMRPTIIFESKPANGVFKYLVEAFKEDRVRRKMSIEKSGWRTRTQILRRVKRLHKRHVYGLHGQLGPIILRLSNQGLVDVKTTTGKRSRGGHLTEIRIAYDRGVVKRHLTKDVTCVP